MNRVLVEILVTGSTEKNGRVSADADPSLGLASRLGLIWLTGACHATDFTRTFDHMEFRVEL